MKEYKGFTLAEVLITLTIIGIASALTIPTLISRYQKKQYVTALKKSYNVLTNGFRGYMARESVTQLSDTKLFQKINGDYTYSNSNQYDFEEELAKIFPITKFYGTSSDNSSYYQKTGYGVYNYLNSKDGRASYGNSSQLRTFVLNDGTTIHYYFKKNVKKFWFGAPGHAGELRIDVNGIKGPNKLGRDVFAFTIHDNANIYAHFTKYDCDTVRGCCYWKTSNSKEFICESSKESYGWSCAAKIMDEGWQMNY